MAKIRLTSYTFDASEKTVTAGQFSDVTLAGIQLIVNVTDQIIIYNFADSTKGGTLSTDTLTLEYDTTSMSDTDELMILVEDGNTALPAGTNNIGDVDIASIAAGDNNIGNVDIASIAAGDNNIGNVDVVSSALPTGAATSAKQDTLQTAIDAIKTAVEILDNTVSGSESQVDVVGALPAGNNNIGDVDVASIAAGDNNIGNVDIVSMPAVDTELPAAAALADDTANPTVPGVGAYPHGFDGTTWDRLRTAQGDSQASAGILVGQQMGFNDFNYDRLRTNTDRTNLSSGARTTTQTQSDQTNYNGRGIKVVLDVTSAGTGSITLSIQGKDNPSGKYYTILTGAAVTTNSTNVYTIYPGITVAANAAVSDILPRIWRIVITANNANSMTYSCGYSVIV